MNSVHKHSLDSLAYVHAPDTCLASRLAAGGMFVMSFLHVQHAGLHGYDKYIGITSIVIIISSHNSVRGMFVWCQVCGHGGHLQHIQEWLKAHTQCPTGCGHNCVQLKA